MGRTNALLVALLLASACEGGLMTGPERDAGCSDPSCAHRPPRDFVPPYHPPAMMPVEPPPGLRYLRTIPPEMASDFTLDISSAPVDPSSARFIAWGASGAGGWPGAFANYVNLLAAGDYDWVPQPDWKTWGSKHVLVAPHDATRLVAVVFDLYGGGASESDGVDHDTGRSLPYYPIPEACKSEPYCIQGGRVASTVLPEYEDRHLQIYSPDNNHLYELINAFYDSATDTWHASAGSDFDCHDLSTVHSRPVGWTSAIASGQAMTPGMLLYDEVVGATSELTHGFRGGFRAAAQNAPTFVYPASHYETTYVDPDAPPMGARVRLKNTPVEQAKAAGYTDDEQRIIRALQKYGLIVTDVTGDFGIDVVYDRRWDEPPYGVTFPSNPSMGMGRGLLEDFRFGPNYDASKIFTWDDWEVVQLGYQP